VAPGGTGGTAPGVVGTVRDAGGIVEEASDGRTARRDRNRELVLDAALELFRDGELEPNALQVAERSGVSPRSVFRYFEDTEALLRAAIARHLELILPLFALPGLGEGPLDQRITIFVAHRLRLYRKAAATARAAIRRAPSNRIIRDQIDSTRRRLRRQLEAMFEPELRGMPEPQRRAMVLCADALFQFEGVEHLSEHLALTPTQIEDVLERALRALLTPAR
jgi:AcrR family transcriptional regulator